MTSSALPAVRVRGASLPSSRWLCSPLSVILLALLVWPGMRLIAESMASDDGGWTLAHYQDLWRLSRLRFALIASILLSIAVAILSTGLCLAPAWLLVRRSFRGKRVLRAIYTLPLSFAGVIVGFLVALMLGRVGFVPILSERLTGIPWLSGAAYGFAGVLIGYLYFEIPRATLTLEAALERVDFRLADVARSLGASRLQAFFWVVLPSLAPALLSTAAVTFSVSLGSFGVVLILDARSFSVLPLEIFMAYLAFPSDRPAAAAMSVTLLAIALLINYGCRLAFEGGGNRGAAVMARA